MADNHVDALHRTRRRLVEQRRKMARDIAKLPEGDSDRTVRHAEQLIVMQNAIEAVDRAIEDEKG